MSSANSNSLAFFEEIKSAPQGSFAYLEQLITDGADENEWREFKGAYHLTALKEKADELWKIWSKALSAFANASGGVLVFGIDAPNMRAEGFSLAVDVQKLASRLREKMLTMVQPFVPGVMFLEVPRPGSNEGFVVCYIPRSKLAPHQATFPSPQFYLRCQDGSHPCPYEVLRRLFQPTFKPAFAAHVHFTTSRGGTLALNGPLWIKNVGDATAHDVFFVYNGPVELMKGSLWQGVPNHSAGFTTEWPIHPDQTFMAAQNVHKKFEVYELDADTAFEFSTKFYARDAPPIKYTFKVTSELIRSQGVAGFDVHGVEVVADL